MINLIKNVLDHFKTVDVSNKPVPCVECGACCNYFKIKFDRPSNPQVPWEKITFYNPSNLSEVALKGAEKFKGKCSALEGKIGERAICSIYENRPDVCAAFPVWMSNGKQNPRCIKAREFHGLKGKIEE